MCSQAGATLAINPGRYASAERFHGMVGQWMKAMRHMSYWPRSLSASLTNAISTCSRTGGCLVSAHKVAELCLAKGRHVQTLHDAVTEAVLCTIYYLSDPIVPHIHHRTSRVSYMLQDFAFVHSAPQLMQLNVWEAQQGKASVTAGPTMLPKAGHMVTSGFLCIHHCRDSSKSRTSAFLCISGLKPAASPTSNTACTKYCSWWWMYASRTMTLMQHPSPALMHLLNIPNEAWWCHFQSLHRQWCISPLATTE